MPPTPHAPQPTHISPELVARLERAEAAALLSLHRESEALGAHSTSIAGAVLTALTSLDDAFFNRVTGLGSQGPVTAADVDACSAWFRSLDRRNSFIPVPTEVTTPELAGWLEGAGYRRGRNWVRLAHDLEAIADAPTSLRIEPVGAEHADAFADIVVEAMEIPPIVAPIAAAIVGADGWHTYMGFDGDTPVATGAIHIEGDTAWIGFGATREAARGRGGQSALFARRLRDARDLGCTLAVTETGEETEDEPVNTSYRNMLRAGFTLAYARPNWVRLEAPPAG